MGVRRDLLSRNNVIGPSIGFATEPFLPRVRLNGTLAVRISPRRHGARCRSETVRPALRVLKRTLRRLPNSESGSRRTKDNCHSLPLTSYWKFRIPAIRFFTGHTSVMSPVHPVHYRASFGAMCQAYDRRAGEPSPRTCCVQNAHIFRASRSVSTHAARLCAPRILELEILAISPPGNFGRFGFIIFDLGDFVDWAFRHFFC